MKVNPIKTHKIIPGKENLFRILEKYLPPIKEKCVVVITSKIVSICEGQVIKINEIDKDELIVREADYYLPRTDNQFNVTLTIKNNILAAAAGIDESNGNGYYILWPKDPQNSANQVRKYLAKKHSLKNIGVIITDSKTTPLRWGTTGIAIAHSGFLALKNYIDTPDIFGRYMHMTKANIMDALAESAVLVMGEGDEQTPLAVIEDVPFVNFQNRYPTDAELKELHISIKDDLYSSLLKSVKWLKGKGVK